MPQAVFQSSGDMKRRTMAQMSSGRSMNMPTQGDEGTRHQRLLCNTPPMSVLYNTYRLVVAADATGISIRQPVTV